MSASTLSSPTIPLGHRYVRALLQQSSIHSKAPTHRLLTTISCFLAVGSLRSEDLGLLAKATVAGAPIGYYIGNARPKHTQIQHPAYQRQLSRMTVTRLGSKPPCKPDPSIVLFF